LVSTTKVEVDPENETRMLSLELDDSPEQTKKVMQHVAKREGWNRGAEQIDFAPWHDFQRWLATGERRVCVAFAPDLIKLIPAKATRLRRDSGQLIRAIKAHALLHREQRERSTEGEIWATFDDYAAVRPLMADVLSEGAEAKVRKTMPETIEAVKSAARERGGATVNEIAAKLGLDRSATKRRLDHAMRAGQVALLDARHGRAFLYNTTGAPLAADSMLLPTVEQVQEAYEEASVRERNESSARTPPESRAQLHSSGLSR
jgi:hypothetical protein